jgi:hemolysin III
MKQTNKQTIGEEIANSISHGIMAILGIIFMILLLIKSNTSREYIAASIFGFGMINLYLMSTLYHAIHHEKAKGVFQRFDHLSIYILIGGTFAPLLLLLPSIQEPFFLGIGLGPLVFIIQWSFIALGVIFKAIWIKRYQKLHLAIYLVMGWSALIFINHILAFNLSAFYLVILGGISYTIGVGFYVLPKIKYFHFIWHIFVGLGTVFQFIAIYLYIY